MNQILELNNKFSRLTHAINESDYNLRVNEFLRDIETKIKILSNISDLNEKFELFKNIFYILNKLVNFVVIEYENYNKIINLLVNFCLDYNIKFLRMEKIRRGMFYIYKAIFYFYFNDKIKGIIKITVTKEKKYKKILELISEKTKNEENIQNIFEYIMGGKYYVI